jgi:putative sigma-54 modulation protein
VDVQLTGRNTKLDDGFREMVAEKVGRAAKVFESVSSVDVELIEETNPRRSDDRFRLEITSNVGGRIVRIETAASTPEAALDDAVDRFTRTVRRLKERIITSHRKASMQAAARPQQEAEESEVVRLKQFVMKPMSIHEATLQMELLGHEFFFFHNADSDKNSVLYRRRDGRLGLIEPA